MFYAQIRENKCNMHNYGGIYSRSLSRFSFMLRCAIASSKVSDLLYIMDQTVKHPLDVYLDMPTQSEPVHSLACANITEDRFYNTQALAVNAAALFCVNFFLHLICIWGHVLTGCCPKPL